MILENYILIKNFFKLLLNNIFIIFLVFNLVIIINLYFYNIDYMLFIIIIEITFGVILDKRFIIKRKLLLVVSLIFISIIIHFYNLIPNILIKEFFWYTVIVYVSFIFHVLIMVWLYNYYYKRRNEYMCFIVSRISYIFSLWFLVVFLTRIDMFFRNFHYDLVVGCKDSRYEKYIDKLAYMIWRIIHIIIPITFIIKIMLRFFIINFNNFSLFLLGKNKEKLLKRELIKIFFVFIIFFFISIFLGIKRLYLFWIWLIMRRLYEVFIAEKKLGFPTYHINTLVYKYYESNTSYINRIFSLYKEIYTDLMVFDINKFLLNEHLYLLSEKFDSDMAYDYVFEEFPFKIKELFKFYPWILTKDKYLEILVKVYTENFGLSFQEISKNKNILYNLSSIKEKSIIEYKEKKDKEFSIIFN